MKREEAISLLGWFKSKTNREDDLEAIDMAIEALSEPSGDLISRADAIEAVVCHIWHMPNGVYRQFNCENVVREVVEDAIKRLPSAEQVTGKLKKPCDSLLTDDSEACKEQKSKLDLISRELAMERIANDNVFGGMERIHEYNNSTEWNEYLDGISDAITTIFCDVPSADITETETCQKCQETTERILNNQGERIKALEASAEAVQGWIPCSERMPKINQRVLFATSEGRVFVGYREKPDLVWQVTETDGRKHWVYDPESYTDDIEILPKNEDCGFAKDDVYSDGFLSVTSINYNDMFEGVTAWMPLPTPYKGGDSE